MYEEEQSYAQTGASNPMQTKAEETPIARVNSANDRLHGAIDELQKTLEPILGQEPPIAEVDGPDEPPGTFLHNAARGVEMQTARIHRIIRRIEL